MSFVRNACVRCRLVSRLWRYLVPLTLWLCAKNLVVYRTSESQIAASNRCPHRLLAAVQGQTHRRPTIQCGYHGIDLGRGRGLRAGAGQSNLPKICLCGKKLSGAGTPRHRVLSGMGDADKADRAGLRNLPELGQEGGWHIHHGGQAAYSSQLPECAEKNLCGPCACQLWSTRRTLWQNARLWERAGCMVKKPLTSDRAWRWIKQMRSPSVFQKIPRGFTGNRRPAGTITIWHMAFDRRH